MIFYSCICQRFYEELKASESVASDVKSGFSLSLEALEPHRRSRKEFEASVDLLDLSPMPTLEPLGRSETEGPKP